MMYTLILSSSFRRADMTFVTRPALYYLPNLSAKIMYSLGCILMFLINEIYLQPYHELASVYARYARPQVSRKIYGRRKLDHSKSSSPFRPAGGCRVVTGEAFGTPAQSRTPNLLIASLRYSGQDQPELLFGSYIDSLYYMIRK